MIVLKSREEIAAMREAGRLLVETFEVVEQLLDIGVSGEEIDQAADKHIADNGAEPAFKGYHAYPATVCFSMNQGVVHGIPDKRQVKEGDIVSIDIGLRLKGFYADAAKTYEFGRVSETAHRLIEVTRESLDKGIDQCRVGSRLGDVSAAVQRHVEKAGFSVVRDLVGHGIGMAMHEDPAVPNFGEPESGPLLKEGMVLAIEPMVNVGGPEIELLEDQWSYVTADGSLSAHFEHTVAITREGPRILTAP